MIILKLNNNNIIIINIDFGNADRRYSTIPYPYHTVPSPEGDVFRPVLEHGAWHLKSAKNQHSNL